jgi:Uma2 family endonuclease
MQLDTAKITVAEYEKMVETGFLPADERVELLGGNIVDMSPIGRRHAAFVSRLNKLFFGILSNDMIIWSQNPVILDDYSEPQPDLVILKAKADFYESAKPIAEDVFLLVEISDSTLAKDRNIKIPLYAKANIQEVWLVNLNEDTVEVYRHPAGNKYNIFNTYKLGDNLSILAFPDVQITVDQIFGKG